MKHRVPHDEMVIAIAIAAYLAGDVGSPVDALERGLGRAVNRRDVPMYFALLDALEGSP